MIDAYKRFVFVRALALVVLAVVATMCLLFIAIEDNRHFEPFVMVTALLVAWGITIFALYIALVTCCVRVEAEVAQSARIVRSVRDIRSKYSLEPDGALGPVRPK